MPPHEHPWAGPPIRCLTTHAKCICRNVPVLEFPVVGHAGRNSSIPSLVVVKGQIGQRLDRVSFRDAESLESSEGEKGLRGWEAWYVSAGHKRAV
jgi:hypothetical protein